MRRFLPLLAILCLAFAPVPFPKPNHQVMVGVWDVDWDGTPVRLVMRPDGSARFEYTIISGVPGTGAWDGSWKFNKAARRVTLTLLVKPQTSHDYVLDFTVIGRDRAEGRIQGNADSVRRLKMVRSGKK